MPSTSHNLMNYLRMVTSSWRDDPRDDATLLARFAGGGDEAAFRVLVGRHGPLVWRTCQHILGDTPDAEDTFQATFLALARKAGRLPVTSLAGWLHQVARRAALNTDAGVRRRRDLEQRLRTVRHSAVGEGVGRAEMYTVLDEELAALPERLRVPLALRYLEGKTLEEVARIVGCSRPVVSKRLVRAEALLRERLERRGLGMGVLSIGALLTSTITASAVPARLVGNTARAAVAFRSGVLTGGTAEAAQAVLEVFPVSMETTVMHKSLWIVLACCLGLAGAGLVTCRTQSTRADESGETGPAAAQAPSELGADSRAAARVDRYGDPLPEGALARMGTTRLWNGLGYSSTSVWSSRTLAFSPDGKTLAAQGPGRTVCFWDTATGKRIRRLTDAGRLVALSPDSQTLITAMPNERDIRLWEMATGKFLRELKYQGPKNQEDHLLGITFLPNGKLLAVEEFYNVPGDWRMCWWDVSTGKEIHQLKKWEGRNSAATFSSDGKMLATVTNREKIIYLWEAATGKEIRQLARGHLDGVSTMAFSNDGKMLASVDDRRICVWEVATGKKIHLFGAGEFGGNGHPLLFSPDGKTLVGGCSGHCWDVVTGKELRSFGWANLAGPPGDDVRCAAFSPDGKIVATSEPQGVIRLWEVATGKEIGPRQGHRGAICSIAYSPDSKTLISGSDDRTVGLWEVATGKEIRRLPRHEGWGVYSVAYSLDGKILASTDITKGYLWEAATGKQICQFRGLPQSPVVFSPDGKILAIGMRRMDDSVVSLRDVTTGKEVHSLLTYQDVNIGFWSIAFSPDGRLLAATGKHDTIGLWEMATGKLIGQLNLGELNQNNRSLAERMVISFAFSPDSRMLAAAMRKGETASLWEIASGKKIRQLKGLKGKLDNTSGWSFTFSPDGRVLAAAGGEDRKVRLWEVATGKEIGQLNGHKSSVRTVVFSPDGKTLASCSDDTTCLIWDATLFAGRLKPVRVRSHPSPKLPQEQLEAAWTDLANANDPAKAFAAIRVLQAVPTQAIALLQTRIQPVAPLADPQQLQRWIADLNDGSFTVRNKARREIEKLGEPALSALRQALKGRPALEAKRRLQDLLAELEPKGVVVSPRSLREFRAVQVLESIGTVEARQVLQALAKGVSKASLTREAQAALARLANRSTARP